jgi:hypothetical protein
MPGSCLTVDDVRCIIYFQFESLVRVERPMKVFEGIAGLVDAAGLDLGASFSGAVRVGMAPDAGTTERRDPKFTGS